MFSLELLHVLLPVTLGCYYCAMIIIAEAPEFLFVLHRNPIGRVNELRRDLLGACAVESKLIILRYKRLALA